MSDPHDVLDRLAPLFPPPEPSLERFLRLRDRRRRNRRISAGVVGVAVALAGFLVGAGIIRSSTVPGGERPSPTPSAPLLRHDGEVLQFGPGGALEAVDPATGTARRLIECVHPCRLINDAAWSPDGTRVAYTVSCWSVRLQTYICDGAAGRQSGVWVSDGLGEPVQLASFSCLDTPCPERGYSWSPDGSRIVYARPGPDPGLYVANAGGTGNRLLPGTEAAGTANPTWSPDGSLIAFGVRGRIYVTSPDGGTPRVLAEGQGPLWSPDGTKLAISVPGGDRSDPSRGNSRIDVVNADGSGLTRIGDGYEAAWSPDGTRIAYYIEQLIGVTGGSNTYHEELWVVSPDGSNPTSVLPIGCCLGGIVDDTTTWSPDGTRIAFLDVSLTWRAVRADGGDTDRIDPLPPITGLEIQTWFPCLCESYGQPGFPPAPSRR